MREKISSYKSQWSRSLPFQKMRPFLMVQEYFSLSFKLILILGEIEQYQSEGEKKPCKFPIRWKFRKVLWYKMVSYSSINVLKFSILISSYRTRLRKRQYYVRIVLNFFPLQVVTGNIRTKSFVCLS